jgi:hypothetical protein
MQSSTNHSHLYYLRRPRDALPVARGVFAYPINFQIQYGNDIFMHVYWLYVTKIHRHSS